MLYKRPIFILIMLLIGVCSAYGIYKYLKHTKQNFLPITGDIGKPLDSLNGVKVYYNGSVPNVFGRNKTTDGYNLGLKWQCVEFIKRYYYEYFNHKMPNASGNAKDFFDKKAKDGSLNKDRNLYQYTNESKLPPHKNDIIIFRATTFNKYGHVAIISEVGEDYIEIIQQNPGIGAPSREKFTLTKENNRYKIESSTALGWLSKQKPI